MRVIRIAVLLGLLSLPLVVTPSASALDLCTEARCQPPAAEQNSPYEFQLQAEEGCVPYHFKFLNGTVPPGLTISEDGKVTGTPTVAGTFQFWVALDDSSGPQYAGCQVPSRQSQGLFTLEVLPDLYVATTSLPAGVPGEPYSATLEAANAEAGWPLLWDVTQGSLPGGLSLSESGVISGNPTGADSKTLTIRVREPFRRSGERQLTLTVAAALAASASSPRVGEVGVRYAGKASAAGGTAPFSWTIAGGALPRGVTLDAATGAIHGVPTESGAFSAQLGVRDAGGQSATVSLTIRVAARVRVAAARLPRAAVGKAYRAAVAATGGVAPKRWTVARGALPRGLALNRATGVLHGVPRKSGRYPVTLRVRDRLGATARKTLRLVVR